MSYNSRVTATYRTMFFVRTVMVTNCMACHVFRNTKFGYHARVVTTTELNSRTTRSAPMIRMAVHRDGLRAEHIDTVTTRDAMQGRSNEDFHAKVHQIQDTIVMFDLY
ncbi:hypothetical protein MVEN_01309700 [Mycena venus]|uniref:Uncharacterized protein n=1 Tax=Mycena venus TaxID=2733690 RepID=A0A8H6XYS6_9AGAR|nr:hypothetical protein MVEN_01309700 [Mycena venus]